MATPVLDSTLDQLELGKRTYLSIAQTAAYLGFTVPKTRAWLRRHPDVRRAREGKQVIVWRRDIDDEVAAHAATQERRRAS